MLNTVRAVVREGKDLTVVTLAHRMGMTTVAEGVESGDQLGLLRRTECDLFQGFCFRKPLPAPEVAALLG